jgi:integrase
VDGELQIERSVWKRSEKSTKTDDPRRVTVVGPLVGVLEAQRAWLLETQHAGLVSGLIFPASEHGARAGATRRNVDAVSWYRCSSLLREPIAKVVVAALVPEISPHSFRRTWENVLRRAGVDQLVRRSLAGWRSEAAQEIYASVDTSERRAAGAAVVELVFGKEAAGSMRHPTATPGYLERAKYL